MKENSLVKHERPSISRYHPTFLFWFLFLAWQTLNPIQNEIVPIPRPIQALLLWCLYIQGVLVKV